MPRGGGLVGEKNHRRERLPGFGQTTKEEKKKTVDMLGERKEPSENKRKKKEERDDDMRGVLGTVVHRFPGTKKGGKGSPRVLEKKVPPRKGGNQV